METIIFVTCYIGIGFIIALISEIGYFLLKTNFECKPASILFDEKIAIKSRIATIIFWLIFLIVFLVVGVKPFKREE